MQRDRCISDADFFRECQALNRGLVTNTVGDDGGSGNGSKHGFVTAPGMIRMAMGDDRFFNPPMGVDKQISCRTVQAFGSGLQERTHKTSRSASQARRTQVMRMGRARTAPKAGIEGFPQG